MMNILHGFTRLLFPPYANCLVCGARRIKAAEPPLCASCAMKLTAAKMPQNICERCGHLITKPGCSFCDKGVARKITWMRAAYVYQDTAAGLVWRLKYSGIDKAGHILAEEMAHVFLSGHPPPVRLVTSVPIDRKRLYERGGDHARVLALAVAQVLDLPYEPLLTTHAKQKRQTGLKRAERLKNKKGAYTATRPIERLGVLLIDDVLTTGATAAACADVLLKAGAASVSMLCVAFS